MQPSARTTAVAAVSALALALTTLLSLSGPAEAHPDHDGTGKEAGFDLVAENPSPGGVPMERMSDLRCEDQQAGIFPCKKVDLMSFLPLTELGGSIWSNDVWGWTDPLTGREYALVGLFEGTAFVDVTNGYDPTYLGMLPSHTVVASGGIWRDIKVDENYAYIVSENAGHGMQVFDLTRLRGVRSEQTWTEDSWLGGFGHAHNLAINERSDTAYVVGAVRDVTACDNGEGGPIIVDLSDHASPQIAGCYAGDGYTHDVHCVTYHGPDAAYSGHEICTASNEDTVTVLDASDPADVEMLARVPYDTASYTHQGWFTEDHAYFLLGDELDELEGEVDRTTTYIFDMRDLDAPDLTGTASTGLQTIDHNIFIREGLAYESNYTSSLRIFDTHRIRQGRLDQVGWFDGYPADDSTIFAGSWSNYPWFSDRKVVFTGTEEGLFIVRSRVNKRGG